MGVATGSDADNTPASPCRHGPDRPGEEPFPLVPRRLESAPLAEPAATSVALPATAWTFSPISPAAAGAFSLTASSVRPRLSAFYFTRSIITSPATLLAVSRTVSAAMRRPDMALEAAEIMVSPAR